jgi:hypothetical protein
MSENEDREERYNWPEDEYEEYNRPEEEEDPTEGTFLRCKLHGIPYPQGAVCPECEPPEATGRF